MEKPKDKQFVTAKFLYLEKELEAPGQFLEKQNGVIFDFYSGTGFEPWEKIISWSPREVTGIPGHPWTNIENGIA